MRCQTVRNSFIFIFTIPFSRNEKKNDQPFSKKQKDANLLFVCDTWRFCFGKERSLIQKNRSNGGFYTGRGAEIIRFLVAYFWGYPQIRRCVKRISVGKLWTLWEAHSNIFIHFKCHLHTNVKIVEISWAYSVEKNQTTDQHFKKIFIFGKSTSPLLEIEYTASTNSKDSSFFLPHSASINSKESSFFPPSQLLPPPKTPFANFKRKNTYPMQDDEFLFPHRNERHDISSNCKRVRRECHPLMRQCG